MRGLRRRTGSGTRWRRCFGDPSFPPGSPHSRPPEILDLGRGRLCVSATGETYPAWRSELAPVQLLGQPRLFNVVFRIIQADFSRFALEGLEKLGASESRQQHSHRAPPPAERERDGEITYCSAHAPSGLFPTPSSRMEDSRHLAGKSQLRPHWLSRSAFRMSEFLCSSRLSGSI